MKNLIQNEFVRILFAITLTLGLAQLAVGAPRKDARVTEVIKDVRLLASGSGARAAAINDQVANNQAVRTGVDSKAELTFTDQTITRLGANTIFSYSEGAKEFELAGGAMLMCVPKEAGTVKINTAAATAAVTGFTAMTEYHKKSGYKFIVLEGEACIKLRNAPDLPCMRLGPGEMLFLPADARRFPPKKEVNIEKIKKSAGLLKGFNNKLPGWAENAIDLAANNQGGEGSDSGPTGRGPKDDPTGTGKVDQAAQANSTPTGSATPHSSPPGELSRNNKAKRVNRIDRPHRSR